MVKVIVTVTERFEYIVASSEQDPEPTIESVFLDDEPIEIVATEPVFQLSEPARQAFVRHCRHIAKLQGFSVAEIDAMYPPEEF